MTDYQKEKLSKFIDDLIEYKFDLIWFDSHLDRKKEYFTIDVDTLVPVKNNTASFSVTQKVHFAVSTTTGLVLLYKDDYEDFRTHDLEFAKKYSEIIKNCINKKLDECLDGIVNSTYAELKIQRESNIKKLIN